MIINFFHKKRVTKQPIVCQGLVGVNDCSFIAELRQLQKELDETNQRIQQLQNEHFDIEELDRFFECDSLYFLVRDYYFNYSEVHKEKIIGEALGCITNFDKLIEELKKIYDSQALLAQEHNTATELSNKISNIKQQLGIK